MTDADSVLVLIARIEGKLDAVLQRGEAAEKRQEDHEARIRVLEAKPSVSPRFLWLAVTSGAACVYSIIQFVDYIRQGVMP